MGTGEKKKKKHKKKDRLEPAEEGELAEDLADGGRKSHKHKKKHKHKSKKDRRGPLDGVPPPREIDDDPQLSPKRARREEPPPSEQQELSLSVAETNKLRAKLGLPPLQMDSASEAKVSADGEPLLKSAKDGGEFVHRPADSWTSRREADKIRERLAASRDRRRIEERLQRVRGLGEVDEESAASWVAKSREQARQRQLASERAKMLEEMDSEFGVGTLVEEARTQRTRGAYQSSHLGGMRVEHAEHVFQEGRDTVLVLKDSDVLADEEDVLVNPTILELEQWKHNAELRKKKPGYNPYEEELDPLAPPKELLSQYDETEKPKQESFRLGAGGKARASEKADLEEIRAQLKARSETLETAPLRLATEYLTPEELARFKKPKKKGTKKTARKRLTADDLLDGAPTEQPGKDLGSRAAPPAQSGASVNSGDVVKPGVRLSALVEPVDMDIDYDLPLPDLDSMAPIVEEDAAESELALALQRTRRLKQTQKTASNSAVAKLAARIKSTVKDEPEDNDDMTTSTDFFTPQAPGGSIVLDSISEYCRGLGDIPTFGMAGNRADGEVATKDYANEDEADDEPMLGGGSGENLLEYPMDGAGYASDGDEKSERPMGTWVEADFEAGPSGRKKGVQLEREAILEEEPDIATGVAGALELANKKGYLEEDEGSGKGAMSVRMKEMQAQNYSIMDKQFQDIDDKYARKLERMGMGGPIQEFPEKSTYTPTIKLEYVDETGREMRPKEAFNFLSWKFHGKYPGKKKKERLQRRLLEEQLMKEMTSSDTPLGTLEKQLSKQQQLQVPYIVLSGSGAKDPINVLRKD